MVALSMPPTTYGGADLETEGNEVGGGSEGLNNDVGTPTRAGTAIIRQL